MNLKFLCDGNILQSFLSFICKNAYVRQKPLYSDENHLDLQVELKEVDGSCVCERVLKCIQDFTRAECVSWAEPSSTDAIRHTVNFLFCQR